MSRLSLEDVPGVPDELTLRRLLALLTSAGEVNADERPKSA